MRKSLCQKPKRNETFSEADKREFSLAERGRDLGKAATRGRKIAGDQTSGSSMFLERKRNRRTAKNKLITVTEIATTHIFRGARLLQLCLLIDLFERARRRGWLENVLVSGLNHR